MISRRKLFNFPLNSKLIVTHVAGKRMSEFSSIALLDKIFLRRNKKENVPIP